MNTKEIVKRVIEYNDWLWEHNWKYYFGLAKWKQKYFSKEVVK